MSRSSVPLKTKISRFLGPLTLTLLAACASNKQVETGESSNNPGQAAVGTNIEKIDDRPFTPETLYALLTAEMAIDRKRYDVALGNYVQQAVSTRDPEIVAKAAHISSILKAHTAALEMSKLWLDIEPDSTSARKILNLELINANRLEEALEQSTELLRKGLPTDFDKIAIKTPQDNHAMLESFVAKYLALTKSHPNNVQLHVGLSILQQKNNALQPALKSIKHAIKLAPDNIRAAFQESRLLQKLGRQDEAIKRLKKLVEEHPDNIGLRARYAQTLADTDLNQSEKQFSILNKQAPNNPDILFSLGLIEKENGKLDSAIERFQTLLIHQKHQNAAHYHIGKTYDRQEKTEDALEHYLQVRPSQQFLESIARATEILVNTQREYDAIQLIREHKENTEGQYLEGLFLLEAEVLSSVGQVSAAELVFDDGLKAFPQSTQLLYARAMLYVNINYISGAEQDLKHVIKLIPNNAAALNALGYTLADQTTRYDEAYQYILQALALTPKNPAVLDSVGWVEYRRGNLQLSIQWLRQAMEAMPDPEIAAHLGEVLWISGIKDEAVKVWKQGLQLRPNNEIIHKTIHRLDAEI